MLRTRILSEECVGQMRDRKSGSKPVELVGALAEAAGLVQDELDIDLGGSAYRVEKLLLVRAHSYCMAGAYHLSNWMTCIHAFMNLCTKKPPEGFRAPNMKEAEEADKAAICAIFELVFDGASLDDAINTVVCDRSILRALLVPQVKVVKASAKVAARPNGSTQPPGGGPRQGGRDDKRKNSGGDFNNGKRPKVGLCHGRQEGRCSGSEQDCKFQRKCSICFSTSHGASACPANPNNKN